MESDVYWGFNTFTSDPSPYSLKYQKSNEKIRGRKKKLIFSFRIEPNPAEPVGVKGT